MGKIGNKRKSDLADDKIIEIYHRTGSAYAVVRETGISSQTVYRILLRHNVPRTGLELYRKNAARFDLETSQKIRLDYERGMSFSDLVGEHGGTEYSIKQAIKRVGGKLIPICPPANEDEISKIAGMYMGGMSQQRISLEIGRSQSFVSDILKKAGIPLHARSREKHGSWNGGRVIDDAGYVRVLLDPHSLYMPMSMTRGYIMEHRLVMAQKLGRLLLPTETVHHINGDKADNRPENLQLRQGKHGKNVVMCCLDCGSRNIGPSPLDDD